MKRVRTISCAVGALFLLFSLLHSLAAAPTTEEVLAKIVKAEDDLKSYQGDMKAVEKFPTGEADSMAFHFAVEFTAKDDRPVMHRMFKTEETKQADGKTRIERWVDDGEFSWIEIKWPATGGILVNKSKTGNSVPDEVFLARDMRENFDIKLTAEDMLDGEKTWVLEGPSREKRQMGPGDNGLAKVRMVVNQTDCMLRRMVLYDKDGKEMAEMRFTNVKVNGPIDPALFKYTPPDGVKINDMTGGVLPAPKEKTPKDDEKRNEE